MAENNKRVVGKRKNDNQNAGKREAGKRKIVLVGNPNAGKTTLFNALTGRNEKVGNWHGVTVESVSATARLKNETAEIIDVPGIYSLKNHDAEENAAAETLKEGGYSLIVVVIEAEKLKRGLRLIRELKSFGVPIVAFINLYADFLKRGGELNAEEFGKSAGIEVICGEAINESDVRKLKKSIFGEAPILRATNEPFGYVAPKKRRATLEKIVTGKFTALPVFVLVMLFCFWFAFGNRSPIAAISGAISRLLNDFIAKRIYDSLSSRNFFLARLLSEGVIGGLSGVAEFIPQICALSFCLDFLDQSGYLSRISAVTDGALKFFSLSGKSVYSLSCGFGCTAVSAVTANGIDDENVRLRAVLSMPFISCSARTPVYLFVAKAAFEKYAFLVICGVYLLSLVAPLVHSLLLSKTVIKEKPEPLTEEIADLKIPKLHPLLKSLLKTFKEFIIRLSTVVFCVSLAVWLGANVSPNVELLPQREIDRSVLARLGSIFAFAFRPMGFDWRMPAALFSGIFAKESVVSSFALLYPEGLRLAINQGLALIAFCYLYTPCLTALSAIRKTIGFKYALISAVYQLLVALSAAYAIYFFTGIFI